MDNFTPVKTEVRKGADTVSRVPLVQIVHFMEVAGSPGEQFPIAILMTREDAASIRDAISVVLKDRPGRRRPGRKFIELLAGVFGVR